MGMPLAQNEPEHRGVGPLGWLFRVFIVYFVLVFGGGTLIKTGHPVATETGRLMQTVTFVHPTINWAQSQGYDGVARGLRALAGGASVNRSKTST